MKTRQQGMIFAMALVLRTTALTVMLAVSGTYAQMFTTIDVPNAVRTEAWAINASGEIVGYFTDASQRTHGFVRTATGALAAIDVPHAILTQAFGLNDNGAIVGRFQDANNLTHGFLVW
jgi:probable HAF family extracellular repeat protein